MSQDSAAAQPSPSLLHLLGVPCLGEGTPARVLESERRTQMLAYLAWRADWVGRAEVAALLWPEQERKLALTNLRKAVHRLQADHLADLIESDGGALRYRGSTDLQQFQSALQRGQRAEALALWRGEFLSGFDDDGNPAWTGWLDFERARLRSIWRAAVRDHLAEVTDPALAVEHALRLHEEEPFDEDALRLALECLARAGQGGRVQQVYLDHSRRLRDELGLEPGADLLAFVAALRGQPVHSPVPGAGAPAGDGFVGRVSEIRQISSLLTQPDCRLLSLTGAGGMGKTRLAQELVARLGPGQAGGGLFVQLEDLAQAAQVPARLAQALGLKLKPGTDDVAQLVAHVGDAERLIVFDNFEHVAEASALLVRLLAGCAGLRILVTSRERLGLADEWLIPLDGLPCPDPEDRGELEQFDAARLFVRAARRLRPDFAADEEADAIIEICQRVAGLPLALELAAAWVPVLSCAEVARELRAGPDLLQASSGERPGRHASMENVFNSSWSLLNPLERETLARLSVFAGSFTADAARVVAGARLPILRTLADKSLLRREGERLSLHPLVQQLSALRLDAGGWRAASEAAHGAYFHALLHRLRPGPAGVSIEGLAAISADFANIRLAWHYAARRGDGGALLRSLPALVSFCEDRARFVEGVDMTAFALAEPRIAADPVCTGGILAQRAQLMFRLTRPAEADALAAEALTHLGDEGPEELRYRAITVRGSCAVITGHPADALRFYEQALPICRSMGDRTAEAATLENVALAEKYLGHYDVALQRNMECLALHRRNGDVPRTALSLINLGSFQVFLGQMERGEESLLEALQLAEKNNLVSTRAFALANLVELAHKRGDLAAAGRHALLALPIAEETGLRGLSAWLQSQLARLASKQGALGEARRWLRAAADLCLSTASITVKAEVVKAFSDFSLAAGHPLAGLRALHFGSRCDDLLAPNRKELGEHFQALGGDAAAEVAWPSMAIDEFLRRIVIEAEAGFIPLIQAIESA